MAMMVADTKKPQVGNDLRLFCVWSLMLYKMAPRDGLER